MDIIMALSVLHSRSVVSGKGGACLPAILRIYGHVDVGGDVGGYDVRFIERE